MQPDPPQRSRRPASIRLLVVLVLSVLAIGVASSAAPSAATGVQPILPPGQPLPAEPTPIPIDVSKLVPATVELSIPVVCGDLTVYDQEDLNTLCSPTTLAARPILSSSCPQVVAGSVRLEVDITCSGSDGLIVGSDNTVIDLNGHTIRCVGSGFMGTCQGLGPRGIYTNGRDNVHIFSHRPGGTITGFSEGVWVQGPSNNVKVKQLLITGPAAAGGAGRPFNAIGVLVYQTDCSDSTIRIGGGTKTGNEIWNNNVGVFVEFSQCVYVGKNSIHDNNGTGHAFQSNGIFLGFGASDNHVHGNVAERNGRSNVNDGGVLLDSANDNLLVENQVNSNSGHGIFLSNSSSNYVNNNRMLFNGAPPTHHDASDGSPGPSNTWNFNNRCRTQSAPQPPPGVCNPSEK